MYSLAFASLLVALAHVGVASDSSSACQLSDSTCLANLMNSLFAEIVDGNSTLDISTSDPLAVPSMTLSKPIYAYNKTNSVFKGFKQCTFSDVTVGSDSKLMAFIATCPSYNVGGDVGVYGYLLYEFVYGDGTYNISCGLNTAHVYVELEQVTSSGETHLQFGKFSLYSEQKGSCSFELGNLYAGNETLTATAAQFVSTYWDEVFKYEDAKYMLEPAYAIIFSNFNKILMTKPYSQLIST